MKQQLTLVFTFLCASIIAQQPLSNPLTEGRRAFFDHKTVSTAIGQEAIPKTPKEKPIPYMEWQSPTHNFGVVNRGKPVSGIFAFRNIGKEPILIKDAKGVCGCTGVEFPKVPIFPGEIAEIVATYDAEVIGPFKKEVTVQTNLDAADEKTVLYIEGEVIWQF